MDCNQKSGVHLNISCKQEANGQCQSCQKEVCNIHLRELNTDSLCEDCYWEQFLYDKEIIANEIYIDTADTFAINTSTSSSSTSEPSGFKGGFGGGEFGGAGASGSWTEGDAESFNENAGANLAGGLLADDAAGIGGMMMDDTDDTFFYS